MVPEAVVSPPTPRSRAELGAGRERLAEAVRTLMTATVCAEAPPEVLVEMAVRVDGLAQELATYSPEPGPDPVVRYSDDPDLAMDASALAARMPFDMIIGAANPLAPPLVMEIDPPKAIGRTVFSPPFQGAPGCVHGAVLAGVFDIVLTAANSIASAAGPTKSLSIRYRKPTLLSEPCVFEGWVTRLEGRRTFSQGRLLQGGIVTVEAEGEFVAVDADRIATMHRRTGGTPTGDAD
jgi:acyl-coenzyme A thioesterase PaaI-like protein